MKKGTLKLLGCCLTLLLCIGLWGCNKKENTISELQTNPYVAEQQVNQIENMTIYVYNEESSRLESKVVQITVYPDQTKAEAVLNYLMSMEDFEFALNSYEVPDYQLTIAGGIAKVNITNEYRRSYGRRFKAFALHFSIVNTLCNIDGIDYVSVYAGNEELAGSDYIGPSRFLETSLSDYYSEYDKSSVYAQHPMLLYYGDKTQAHITPQPDQVYSNIDNKTTTISSIVEKLSKAPFVGSDLTATIATELKVNKVSLSDNTMSIDFDKNPCPITMINQAITYGSLFHTIKGVYPQVHTLRFTVNDTAVTINGMNVNEVNKDSFSGIIGSPVTLYMVQNSINGLYPINRYLSTSSGISVNQLLSALAANPEEQEYALVTSPFMGGLTIDNVISSKIVNDVAIINFDTGFFDCVKNMSPEEETHMVYGIVNTLTAREQINRVQFLINNQSFDTISGHIYYNRPLFANPGIVIQN